MKRSIVHHLGPAEGRRRRSSSRSRSSRCRRLQARPGGQPVRRRATSSSPSCPNANGLRDRRLGDGRRPARGHGQGRSTFLPVDDDTTRNLRVVIVRSTSAAASRCARDSRARAAHARPARRQGARHHARARRATPCSRANDTLPSAPSLDYDAVLAQASGAVDDVVRLTTDLREITGGHRARARARSASCVTEPRALRRAHRHARADERAARAVQSPNGTVGRLSTTRALQRPGRA